MSHWQTVNDRLLAKAISELHFEEVLSPVSLGNNRYRLPLQKGATYLFDGRMSAWGHLWVKADSISRTDGKPISAAQFFIDSQPETQMSDITLATFLEELNDTLYSDLKMLESHHVTVAELALLGGEEVQHFLNGHPKLLLNKGRMGWGADDLARYSPEAKPRFQLRWILVNKKQLRGEVTSIFEALEQSFRGDEKEQMRLRIEPYLATHDLMPVHPWQWENIIKLQFQGELQNKNLIDLGIGGDFYSPQISIRTLSNVVRPLKNDIKLPLSILNTSCVRGLPQKYLPITPVLSRKLVGLCQTDKLLKSARVDVLSEVKAIGYIHPHFHQVDGAAYRYHEHLGAVWRESAESKLLENEKTVLAASLFYQDAEGKTLIDAFVAKSNKTISEWLTLYARHVIIPLYHLQLAYGVGLVAHGQNVVVRLKNFVPAGLFLKDFHGDLRLSTTHHQIHQKHFSEVADYLTHLPPEHLIHDLITGHFITVLRFLGGALEDAGSIKEKEFYQILAAEIKSYQKNHSTLVKKETDILAPKFQRVLVNRVRFKIGYGDNAERPLPILGSLLKNPLAIEDKR